MSDIDDLDSDVPDEDARSKRERLESAGWRTGTVQEMLGLTDEEADEAARRAHSESVPEDP